MPSSTSSRRLLSAIVLLGLAGVRDARAFLARLAQARAAADAGEPRDAAQPSA